MWRKHRKRADATSPLRLPIRTISPNSIEIPSTPYVIEHSGAVNEKLLCLTFDDGPDRRYTPEILDILKQRQVLATFFVIGVNAENFPGLIRREYAEGHEIGNHTYTHPNIAATSAFRTELELSTTQRIIENLLGVSDDFFPAAL